MKTATYEVDNFADNFSLLCDTDGADWPALEAVVSYVLHPPEPDVGIFNYQSEIRGAKFYVDGVLISDFELFATTVYEAIAGDIEEDEDAVTDTLRKSLDEFQHGLEDEVGDD